MWLQNGSSLVTLVRPHAGLAAAGVPPLCEDLMFIVFPDDGRATNPSSTHEAITQVWSRFHTANGNTSPSGMPVVRFVVLTPIPSLFVMSRSSRTLRISPSPRTPPRMIRRMGTSSSYVKRRGMCPNQSIIPTRSVTLSCTISRSERRSKNYIGHSKTMKSFLRYPLSGSFHNSRPVAEYRSTSCLTSIQYVTLMLSIYKPDIQ